LPTTPVLIVIIYNNALNQNSHVDWLSITKQQNHQAFNKGCNIAKLIDENFHF